MMILSAEGLENQLAPHTGITISAIRHAILDDNFLCQTSSREQTRVQIAVTG